MRKKLTFSIILTAILVICFFNTKSFATFNISDFTINSEVLENGDMEVEEKITYTTTVHKNGVIRDIKIKNPDNKLNSADEIKLESVSVNGLTYNKTDIATNGDSGVYENTINKDGISLKVYSPMVSGNYVVVYKYLLKNVAVKYNDTAELFWNFIGDGWDTEIKNLKINITLPTNSVDEKIYVFGH